MTPWKHALSSASHFGGEADEYVEIHNWFDETKAHTGDWTHRALRHHAAGIEEAIRTFGHSIRLKMGRSVAVKEVAERHIIEDCGYIPTIAHWLAPLRANPEMWMLRVKTKTKDLDA
jgi:hypothetical protein